MYIIGVLSLLCIGSLWLFGILQRFSTVGRKRMPGEKESIPITTLGLTELRQVRERVDLDAQKIQQSRMQLQRVASSFQASHKAIKSLKGAENGQEIMLPLSGSLYITGQLESIENVLVDIGTGYFCERSVDDAMKYCERKAEKLSGNIKDLGEALGEKQKALTHINQVLMNKQQEAEAKPGPS